MKKRSYDSWNKYFVNIDNIDEILNFITPLYTPLRVIIIM